MLSRIAILLLALFAGSLCARAQETSESVPLWRQIQAHMKARLSQEPNYTCLETVSRGIRHPSKSVAAAKRPLVRPLDVVRLEVAEVGNDELFAMPGEHKFQRKEYSDVVKGGLMGSGMFSGFSQDIFGSKIATVQFQGSPIIDGRPLLQYGFLIPRGTGWGVPVSWPSWGTMAPSGSIRRHSMPSHWRRMPMMSPTPPAFRP
jgi:hypothetical protein